MEIDDIRPESEAERTARVTRERARVLAATERRGGYFCPNCEGRFDKPENVSYGWGSFIVAILLSILGWIFAATGVGMIIAVPILALASCAFVAFSVSYGIAVSEPKKKCPHCGYKYIYNSKA